MKSRMGVLLVSGFVAGALCTTQARAGDKQEKPNRGTAQASSRLVAAPDVAPTYPQIVHISNDVDHDQEPVVISNTINGFERSFVAYMKRSTQPNGRIWLATFGKLLDQREAPFAVACDGTTLLDTSGDPAVAQNEDDTRGVAPNRMYVVGTSYDNVWTQISLWYTDTGGDTWSAPVRVSACESHNTVILDKPAIAVSQYQKTRGFIYVVAARVNLSGGPTQFPVYESRDGGRNFFLVATVTDDFNGLSNSAATRWSHAPQIMVDDRGGVWVFWLDYDQSLLHGVHGTYVADNLGGTLTFPGHCAVLSPACIWPSGYPFGTWRVQAKDTGFLLPAPAISGSDMICRGGACTRAHSMLVGRYNRLANQMALAWHSREQSDPNSATDLHIAAYSATSQAWNSVVLGDAGFQWNPAIDSDASGNYVVSFYDSGSDSGLTYRLVFRGLNSALVVLPPDAVTLQLSNPNGYELGEYQGLFFWNGHFNAVFTYIQGLQEDIYSTTVTP